MALRANRRVVRRISALVLPDDRRLLILQNIGGSPMSNAPDKTTLDPSAITHYHAHIYYDPAATRQKAARLREAITAAFPEAIVGRWHDALVGPHMRSMYQVAFPSTMLAAFLPWLMFNRDGLAVLLHPESGNAVLDHTAHAAWLGEKLPVLLDALGPINGV
jgi:DOPA 4,5-dioxygenase